MDSMLQGIPGVCVYLDDILVRCATDSEHRQRLDRVLEIYHLEDYICVKTSIHLVKLWSNI